MGNLVHLLKNFLYLAVVVSDNGWFCHSAPFVVFLVRYMEFLLCLGLWASLKSWP